MPISPIPKCPIWVSKKEKWAGESPATNAKGGPKGKEKAKGSRLIFLFLGEELGQENEETPAIEVNCDFIYINLCNIDWAMDWGRNRAEESPSVIDAGIRGGRLRIFLVCVSILGT